MPDAVLSGAERAGAYSQARQISALISGPLSAEDQQVQSMPDVSPTKWHLAHTTWFFERFILSGPGYTPFDPDFDFLFNSYYHTVGTMHDRPRRGLLTRPGLDRIRAYREYVDDAMGHMLCSADSGEVGFLTRLGIHHEQQHQELMLMDIKHVLSCHPFPTGAYPKRPAQSAAAPLQEAEWWCFDGGMTEIGHAGDGFCFDHETPRHAAYLHPFRLASRPVSNGEYLRFIEAGGYGEVSLWLSDAWARIKAQGWAAPLYWHRDDDTGDWMEFTLSGLQPLERDAPVRHVSYYEADAYARWAGARLPTETEWEHGMARKRQDAAPGRFLDDALSTPDSLAAPEPSCLKNVQSFGDVWEWTASPYTAYPGFRPLAGSLGEYNGKFMCDQFVLRGGSCVTPADHIRLSYRNFFPPAARWAFSGLRLASDTKGG